MEDILQKLLEKPSKNINDENNLSSDEIENTGNDKNERISRFLTDIKLSII